MGIVIPVYKIDDVEFVKKVLAIKGEALKLGKQLIDAKELVVRPLRPADFGLAVNEWTFSVSAGENTIVSTTLDDKTLVVVYGIYNLSTSPATTEVIFGTTAKVVEDVYVEDMYLYDVKATLLDEPVVFQPGSSPLIKIIAKDANTAEKVAFLGFVIEPAGRRIGSSG